MQVAIVAVEGSLLSAIAGIADMFWMTNQAANALLDLPGADLEQQKQVRFDTVIVSADGRPMQDAQGRLIPVEGSFQEFDDSDVVLVTGMALGADKLPPASASVHKAAEWMKQMHQRGAMVGAACAGTFVLGEAGLLDKRRCTTTWWLHHAFKKKFPSACLTWGAAIEEQDGIITTGGPLSWVDLALHVIRLKVGAEVAKMTADISVTDSLPLPQLLYAPRGFINSTDPLLLQAEQIVRHATPGVTAEHLAKKLNMSERTLHRRLKDLTNESPKSFITRVRIETACTLLETPGASIKQVALHCGYTEETAFRRAFIQQMGMTPTDFKRRTAERKEPG